ADPRGRRVRRRPERRRREDSRRVATGDGRAQEDDRKGVRRAAANPDVARPALPAEELREPLLLEAGPVEDGRGRGPKDPEGTREDRQLDVPVPFRDRGGRDLPRVPFVRGAPPAEGDREG